MEVYTQKRLLPEPPEEFVKRLTEWYDDGKQNGKISELFQTAIEALEEVQEYRKIGTVEEFRKAMKKTKPMKPETLDNDFDYYKCPVCGEYIWATDTINDHKYCLNCGQAIDWEESEGEEKR